MILWVYLAMTAGIIKEPICLIFYFSFVLYFIRYETHVHYTLSAMFKRSKRFHNINTNKINDKIEEKKPNNNRIMA